MTPLLGTCPPTHRRDWAAGSRAAPPDRILPSPAPRHLRRRGGLPTRCDSSVSRPSAPLPMRPVRPGLPGCTTTPPRRREWTMPPPTLPAQESVHVDFRPAPERLTHRLWMRCGRAVEKADDGVARHGLPARSASGPPLPTPVDESGPQAVDGRSRCFPPRLATWTLGGRDRAGGTPETGRRVSRRGPGRADRGRARRPRGISRRHRASQPLRRGRGGRVPAHAARVPSRGSRPPRVA